MLPVQRPGPGRMPSCTVAVGTAGDAGVVGAVLAVATAVDTTSVDMASWPKGEAPAMEEMAMLPRLFPCSLRSDSLEPASPSAPRQTEALASRPLELECHVPLKLWVQNCFDSLEMTLAKLTLSAETVHHVGGEKAGMPKYPR